MLKVKGVLFQGGDTGSEKNLIDIAVRNMTDKGLEEVSANLLTYDTKVEHSVNHPVKSELIHGFAQFQTCIKATMHLNSLLLHPFPSPCIPLIFSRTFLYNFCLELSEQKDLEVFIHELLLKASKLKKAYQRLFDAVIESIDPDGLATATEYFNESWDLNESSKERRPRRVETPPLTTSNKFSRLFRRDSESED